MTADDLRKAEARYQRAFLRSEAEREARNAVFRQAHAEGWTHAQIAQAMRDLLARSEREAA